MQDRPIRIRNLFYRNNVEQSKQEQGSVKQQNYAEIKAHIQQAMSDNHAEDLACKWDNREQKIKVKQLIMQYLNEYKLVDSSQSIRQLADRLYEDMVGYTKEIEEKLEDSEAEEININGPNNIIVQYPDRKERLSTHFENAEQCKDIVKKMARAGNVILDGSRPLGDSYISKGVRMSGIIDPCVDNEVGAIASIRKQKKSTLTKEMLVSSGAVLEDAFDFTATCLQGGVSMGFVGATGSGKTGNMNLILGTLPTDIRVYTIEDTKELDLTILDDAGYPLNDIVQTYTVEEKVTMNHLLKKALRFHPDVIVPAEMRGKEAMTAQEAGRTGHVIVSSLHAENARDAYERILTLCMESGTKLSEERMLRNIVKAFPMMIFCKQFRDKSRKWVEIFEATGVKEGEVTGQYIYKYVVSHSEKDEKGKVIKVHGQHKRTGCISQQLAEKLRLNSIDENFIETYRELPGEGGRRDDFI